MTLKTPGMSWALVVAMVSLACSGADDDNPSNDMADDEGGSSEPTTRSQADEAEESSTTGGPEQDASGGQNTETDVSDEMELSNPALATADCEGLPPYEEVFAFPTLSDVSMDRPANMMATRGGFLYAADGRQVYRIDLDNLGEGEPVPVAEWSDAEQTSATSVINFHDTIYAVGWSGFVLNDEGSFDEFPINGNRLVQNDDVFLAYYGSLVHLCNSVPTMENTFELVDESGSVNSVTLDTPMCMHHVSLSDEHMYVIASTDIGDAAVPRAYRAELGRGTLEPLPLSFEDEPWSYLVWTETGLVGKPRDVVDVPIQLSGELDTVGTPVLEGGLGALYPGSGGGALAIVSDQLYQPAVGAPKVDEIDDTPCAVRIGGDGTVTPLVSAPSNQDNRPESIYEDDEAIYMAFSLGDGTIFRARK